MMRLLIALLLAAFVSSAKADTLEQYGGGPLVADNSIAWNLAMQAIGGRGELVLGCTSYKFAQNVVIPPYVTVRGCGGEGSTTIDCRTVTVVGPCLSTTGYGMRLSGVLIMGPNGPGLRVYSAAFVEIEDVGVSDTRAPDATPWDDSCMVFENVWMATVADVRLVNCRTSGFVASGYNTTLRIDRLYSNNSGKSGIYFNGVAYSTCNTCSSDDSGDYGFFIRNSPALSFMSPGSELNEKGMFLITASDADAAGALTPDVKGLAIIAPFSFHNGEAAPYYASFLEALSTNGRKIEVTVIGGAELTSLNMVSMKLNGSGVRVSRTGGTFIGSVAATGGAVFSQLF